MAKKLPPLAEWTRPWNPGELDEDKAAGLLYNLTRDNLAAKERNAALVIEKEGLSSQLADRDDEIADLKGSGKAVSADAKDEEIRTLTKKIRELDRDKGKRSPEDQTYIDRLEVANDHKLSAKDAQRLVGKTREELEADAVEFVERLKTGDGDDPETSGEEQSGGPPARTPLPPAQYRTGGEQGKASAKSTQAVLEGLPPLE